jgi:NADH-quinone oxidoreductase subunit L
MAGDFSYLVPWVLIFPLAGILLNFLVGRWLSEKMVGSLASLASGAVFVVSGLLAISLRNHPGAVTIPLADWMTIGSVTINWAFRVDTLSVIMMLVVSGVGTLIHVYAIGYMHDDVRLNGDPGRFRRFFIFLNLFILAMMILVSADNYLMLFVGWEGVGLCSYLLIGFWHEKGKDGTGNANAAKKAFVVNRIGDFGVLIALFLLLGAFSALDFNTIFSKAAQVAQTAPTVILAITLFMILGVAGKSAQLPLFVWLPDAMAGPTPVSALIHAATMVTAGVYLVARSAPLYDLVPTAQNTVTWVGALTALFAATIAIGQYDIKKVLAYSTISQLGYMVTAVGMGAYTAGLFHLVTHAFFKALLFLAAGSVIQSIERGEHNASHPPSARDVEEEYNLRPVRTLKAEGPFDPQDMRNMGGLRNHIRLTFWVFLTGALALSGIFPLAGFFSKDEILAQASSQHTAVFVILVISAFLTAFYMGRQILLVFFGKARSAAATRATDSPAVMTVPLIVLAVLSVVGGLINLPAIGSSAGGSGITNWLNRWLTQTLQETSSGEFNLTVALTSLGFALLGLVFAYYFYGKSQPLGKELIDPLKRMFGPLFTALERRWWVDELYDLLFVRPFRQISGFLSQPVDLGVINGISENLGSGVKGLAAELRNFQTGFVRSYALLFFLGVVAILGYVLLR